MRDVISAGKKLIKILNKKQMIKILILFIASALFALLETLGVSIILPLTQAIININELMRNNIIVKLCNLLNIVNEKTVILLIIVGTVAIYILKNLYFIFYSWLKNKIATGIENELSSHMLKSYMSRGYMYFVNSNSNSIYQGVYEDTYIVYNVISDYMLLITKVFIIAFIGVYLLVTDVSLSVALLLSAFLCLIIIIKVLKPSVKSSGDKFRAYTIKSNKVLWQSIWGIKELMVSHKQQASIGKYEDRREVRRKAKITMAISQDSPIYIMEMCCVTIVMVLFAFKVMTGHDYASYMGILASFAVGAFRILPAVSGIATYINRIVGAIPSLDAVYENIVESRKYNSNQFDAYVNDDEKYRDMVFNDSIELNNIIFAYNKEDVLRNLDMTIYKGQSIGLVGESGAGKSTLADIILGVILPNEGQVQVDGVPISSIPNRWGELVGFVPQQIYLADQSIKENVAFFEDDENIDEVMVRESLKKANILEFVESLQDGINTKIGDQGVRLSGGQRQRIGIARALYHKPEILILDEATSALDNETEKAVMDAIDSLKSSVTLIIIAHRVTTLKNCDMIYEIKDGKAVERKYEGLI